MYSAIVFLPLFGALIAGFGHRLIGERMAQLVPTGFLMLAAVLSWVAFFDIAAGYEGRVQLANWMTSGMLSVDWALRIDMLTGTMLVVVTTVSSLVHLYSIGYMSHDDSKPRFFAYLSLFTFAMLMLVTADNLAQMFFGWEGVGVASYLLIGFWFKKPSANAAAIKAFIVNRVGDFGFALGIFGVFMLTGSIDFDAVFAKANDLAQAHFDFLGMQVNAAETLCILLFVGAMGKSAQLLLHTWLPDAMEGPTPVSALIHAATMVTAGVFMVCRLSPLFEVTHIALGVVTVIGATTALFAATVGLVQNDIKRVIAYSTCSQLGYMFFAAGVGAYEAAMFHLFTHAFFKALLFLGAGSVIHALHHDDMHDPQDIRYMGGLACKIPQTAMAMLIGTLALTGFGIPLVTGFAGYYSKDMIIEAAYASHNIGHSYAFWVGVVAAAMTSFYSWRLYFMVFTGEFRGPKAAYDHAHESPLVMLIPLYVLAIGAIFAGVVFAHGFIGDGASDFWRAAIGHNEHNHVLHDAHSVPKWVKLSPFIAMVLGLALAVLFYVLRRDLPGRMAATHPGLYQFLLRKWYFDEVYDFLFVRSAKAVGRWLWKGADERGIDGVIYGVASGAVPFLTRAYGRLQSGYVFTYAFVMILGLALLVALLTLQGGGH